MRAPEETLLIALGVADDDTACAMIAWLHSRERAAVELVHERQAAAYAAGLEMTVAQEEREIAEEWVSQNRPHLGERIANAVSEVHPRGLRRCIPGEEASARLASPPKASSEAVISACDLPLQQKAPSHAVPEPGPPMQAAKQRGKFLPVPLLSAIGASGSTGEVAPPAAIERNLRRAKAETLEAEEEPQPSPSGRAWEPLRKRQGPFGQFWW
ncbi:MAG: hypothetical protein GY772_21850 [bacterium]|nr:hypothetical protein [bacterium]